MNKADEKKAFDAMMAEIGDDSDEEDSRPQAKFQPPSTNHNKSMSNTTSFYKAESKASEIAAPSAYGAKSTNKAFERVASRKMTAEEQEIENFGVAFTPSSSEVQSEQLAATKRWLSRPLPRGEKSMMKCFVERERMSLGLHVVYRCYMETSDSQPRFMMSAKKQFVKQTSYYLISLDRVPDDDRGSESVVGKVRGNAVGSKYIITDHGLAPDKSAAPSTFRKELGVIGFEFDSGGPSKVDTWIPTVTPSGVPTVWQPDCDENGMDGHIERSRFDNMLFLKNKTPKWDAAHGGHVLNFQGRVTESSVKNFQLCCPDQDDSDEVILQFGRVGKHKFNMDLRFPLSPVQAFAICVACLDGKIADRKGYEYFKMLSLTGRGDAGGSSANNGDNSSNARQLSNEGSATLSSTSSAAAAGGGPGGMSRTSSMSGAQIDGNMNGTGSLMSNLPSGQYLRDRIARGFK